MTNDKSHIHVSPLHIQDYVPHLHWTIVLYAKYPEAGGKVCPVHYLIACHSSFYRQWGAKVWFTVLQVPTCLLLVVACGSTVPAFPDADLFMTHAAVSLIHTSLFLLGEYTVKYFFKLMHQILWTFYEESYLSISVVMVSKNPVVLSIHYWLNLKVCSRKQQAAAPAHTCITILFYACKSPDQTLGHTARWLHSSVDYLKLFCLQKYLGNPAPDKLTHTVNPYY